MSTEAAAPAATFSGPPPPAQPVWTAPAWPAPPARKGLGWRPLTWVILAFNALMLAWMISGLVSAAHTSSNCSTEVYSDACRTGAAIGTGIAVTFILILWALGDVILGVIWLVTRRSGRTCPVCGSPLNVGAVSCGRCGFDFRQAVGQPGLQVAPVASAPAWPGWQQGPDGQWHPPAQR